MGFRIARYACCICGATVEPSFVDPCALTLVTRYHQPDEKQASQTMWCHAECLKRAAPHGEFHVTEPDSRSGTSRKTTTNNPVRLVPWAAVVGLDVVQRNGRMFSGGTSCHRVALVVG
jgi:hypothetical protein